MGHFIVFEGGEGSGKSAHAEILSQKLENDGFEVLHTREPGGSEFCAKIRALILDESEDSASARAELFLFFADRAHHVETVIQPALDAGTVVICDRFSGSTYAYQLGGRELPDASFVKQMEEYARGGLEPETVVYLDVEPEIGLARRNDKGGVNRLDKEELAFHNKVHAYFLELAKQDTWMTFSTMQGSKEENAEKIYAAIKATL